MLLGTFFRKVGLLDEHSVKRLNQFVFRALLPALLFKDLASADFHKNKTERGEIVQASYRSSAAVLGMAFINNIYGTSTIAAPMIIGTVPLYNVTAVTILSITSPDNNEKKSKKDIFLKTAKEVITNPIILGIVIGLLWSILNIPQPEIFSKTVSYLANIATPLSLISLGASFKFSDAKENFMLSFGVAALKLIVFCSIFLPIAIWMGFKNEKLIAILVMLGSATTSSCFVMARNFGHKGIITACTVMLTTLLSAFTLTIWLFILKTLRYI